MARIRTLKPEFWGDEKLAPCKPLTRLVFLGLISMADDAGRLVDNVKVIDAFIFPESSETCRGCIGELSGMGRIRRGITSSGQRIIQIANWDRHQKIEKPNLKAALPEIVTEVTEPQHVTEPLPNVTDTSGKRRGNVGERSGRSRRTIPTTYDHLPTTNDQRPGSLPADAEAAAPKTTWLTPYLGLWQSRVGALTPKRAAAALAEPRRLHGDEALLQGLNAYLDQPRDPDKPVKIEYFAEKAAVWVKLGAMPLVDPVTRALRAGA